MAHHLWLPTKMYTIKVWTSYRTHCIWH